ncbi:MAG TPA: hypothetical protein VF384_01055 [Planctomycetota bacterium]
MTMRANLIVGISLLRDGSVWVLRDPGVHSLLSSTSRPSLDLAAYVVLQLDPTRVGSRTIELDLLDADGQSLGGAFPYRTVMDEKAGHRTLAWGLRTVTVPSAPGDYVLVLRVDGEIATTYDITIAHAGC